MSILDYYSIPKAKRIAERVYKEIFKAYNWPLLFL